MTHYLLTLLCSSMGGVGLELPVELAGHIADQAASDLAVGLALGPSSLGVGPGRWVIAQPGQDDQVQGLVEVTVPRPVESVADGLAAGGGDGCGAAEHGEGGVRATAASMGPSAQDGGSDDRADSGPTEQVGPPGAHEAGEGMGVLGDLPIQELDPAGQSAQACRSGGGFAVPAALLT
jgi:hypothetical protein